MTNTPTGTLPLAPMCVEKQIGGTIYVVTASFNGDKKRDIVKSIARLIERDGITRPGKVPKMTELDIIA